MAYCSPRDHKYNFTCFNHEEIKKLHQLKIGKSNDDNADNDSDENNVKKMISELKQYFNNDPEYKWMDRLTKDELENFSSDIFIPKKPINWNEDKNAWLSNFDIDNVLTQFELKYKNFLYINASPIDYDTMTESGYVSEMLTKLNLKKVYNEGKDKIGVVFNLDTHDKGGSHWVSLFININKLAIYFCDSVGKLPNQTIHKFIQNIINQGNRMISENAIKDICNIHSICLDAKKSSDNSIEVSNKYTLEEDNLIFILDKNKKNKDLIYNDAELNKFMPDVYYKIVNVRDSIIELDKEIKNQSNNLILVSRSFKPYYNNNPQQKSNTECGVYSINFIKQSIENDSCNENTFFNICETILTDNDMLTVRDKVFRENYGIFVEEFENKLSNQKNNETELNKFMDDEDEDDDDEDVVDEDYDEDVVDEDDEDNEQNMGGINNYLLRVSPELRRPVRNLLERFLPQLYDDDELLSDDEHESNNYYDDESDESNNYSDDESDESNNYYDDDDESNNYYDDDDDELSDGHNTLPMYNS